MLLGAAVLGRPKASLKLCASCGWLHRRFETASNLESETKHIMLLGAAILGRRNASLELCASCGHRGGIRGITARPRQCCRARAHAAGTIKCASVTVTHPGFVILVCTGSKGRHQDGHGAPVAISPLLTHGRELLRSCCDAPSLPGWKSV